MGERKTRRRISASSASPANRSSRLAGQCLVATGGMKRAQAACQSGVRGKSSRHQRRHRSSVRTGMSSVPESRAAAGFCPACRAEPSGSAAFRDAGHPRTHAGTVAPLVAGRLSPDPALASRLRTLHAAGGDQALPRQSARTVCRRRRRSADAPPGLSLAHYGQDGRIT